MAANPLPTQNPNLVSMGRAPGAAATSPFAPASTMGTSIIGSDLTILGREITIISQNRLQIDGDIHGDVCGKQVTISADGSVVGTVSAERIEVQGGVKGAIRAASVVVHPSAQIDAEILHQTLSIAEGAQVEGRLRKSRDENELKPNLDASSYSLKTASQV